MVANGFVKPEYGETAKQKPLSVNPRKQGSYLSATEYFSEEVRREIINRYGENSLYEGGLSIRTTLNPKMQKLARRALTTGLTKFDRKKGYHGAFAQVELGDDWGIAFTKIRPLRDVANWRQAVVLEAGENFARVGLRPKKLINRTISDDRDQVTIYLKDAQWAKRLTIKERGKDRVVTKVKTMDAILQRGDIIHISGNDGNFVLEQVPEVSGALVAMDPHTGRVLAMMGGFSFSDSQFNRATQANRQPGSAF